MANYALVIGINYKGCAAYLGRGSCVQNAIEIHNFFVASGYARSELLLESNADFNSIHKALKSICENLKKGDTFCLYFSGYEDGLLNTECIVPYHAGKEEEQPAKCLSLKTIEEISRKSGVERMLILDWENISGQSNDLCEKAIASSVDHAPTDSPIGIFCGQPHDFACLPERQRNNLSFTSTLLNIFKDRVEAGLAISFPSACKPVSKRLLEWADLFPEKGLTSFYSNTNGTEIVIHSGKRTISDLSGKKRIKAEADELLGKMLEDHTLWRKNDPPVNGLYQLNSTKLRQIIDVYRNENLGTINLANRNLSGADFSSSELIEGIDFSYSDLSCSDISTSSLVNINFSHCSLKSVEFLFSDISDCNFSYSDLTDSNLGRTDIEHCIFDQSSVHRANFEEAMLTESSFRHANLTQTNLSRAAAIDCDFTDANLSTSLLVRVNFAGSTLTGAGLYGTARADWCIKDVKCQHVYWDKDGKERFPPDNDFHEGEFSTQYRPYSMFSYTFKEGFTPLDLMLATHIVDQINAADIGFTIKIDNASVRGLNPTLNFIMESGDDKRADAQELFTQEYEKQIQKLKTELQKANEQLLTERGARANFAEKHLEISAKHQQIMNQFFTPLLAELLQRKDPPIRKRLSHRESEQSNGKVQKVMLCDKSLTVQIGENEPVAFGSVKQYAVFKAVIQASKIQDQRVDLEQIAESAGEIESALTPAKEKKRRGWQTINRANEVSGICHDLREYCEKNGQLGFLMPLILQAYKKSVPLAGYEIEEVEFISDGRPISDY